MKIITLDEIKEMVGKEVTAVGTCGMAKDKLVRGTLLDGFIENEPVIKDNKNTLISVNRNTLKLITSPSTYTVKINQNGGEYSGFAFITCKVLKEINSTTVMADGIRIEFDEKIVEIN